MKPNTAAALVALLNLAALADESTPSIPAASPSPPGLASPPPPIVRLPVSGNTTTETPKPGGTATPPAGETTPASPPTAGDAQLGWSNEKVALRASTAASSRTNRSFETRGAVPRLIKPQRRTVGGFLTSFANLFNPFAPLSPSEAATADHRYDGQYNVAPLPRGFRDERTHEASALIFSTPLESDPDAPKPTPTPAPATH